MLHVVTGYHRSGTSMMMRALAHTTVLAPVIDMDMEFLIRSHQDLRTTGLYDPNPHGYWMASDLHEPEDGQLVKRHPRTLADLPDGCMVVVMERPAQERLVSFKRSFGADTSEVHEIERCEANLADLSNHHTVTVLQYHDVLTDPVAAFTTLNGDGWQINVDEAAALVDPRLYRNRM